MGKRSLANGKGFSAHLQFYEVMGGNGRNRESPDAVFFRNDGETIIVEVKVDRTDFLRDKKKDFRKNPEKGMGTLRYYACPEHLINAQDLPEGWGLIWIPEKGIPYFKVKSAKFEANYRAERDLLFSLTRRCNNYVPIDRLVEYHKIVKRDEAAIMKHGRNHPEVKLLERIRWAFWDKLEKKFTRYLR